MATLIAGFLPPQINLERAALAIWVGIGVLVIPSTAFAFVLPHLKVGFMASVWQLPKNTFLLSRPLLRLIGSSLVGNLLGMIILAFLIGDLHLQGVVLLLPATIVYIYSAGRRLQKHPNSEFAMPMLPYPFGGSMRQTKIRWPIDG